MKLTSSKLGSEVQFQDSEWVDHVVGTIYLEPSVRSRALPNWFSWTANPMLCQVHLLHHLLRFDVALELQ